MIKTTMKSNKSRAFLKYKRIERNQAMLNRKYLSVLLLNLIIIALIMLFKPMIEASGNNKIEGEVKLTAHESKAEAEEMHDHDAATLPANTSSNKAESKVFCRNLSSIDQYVLAKMAMSEAESESLNTKVLVILTILNRVESEKSYFPDTILEVILQKNSNGTYQFTPIGNGRWDSVEPNDECWKAVEIVNYMQHDISQGALYFEACSGDSWHSRNLKLICQSDNTRFYK